MWNMTRREYILFFPAGVNGDKTFFQAFRRFLPFGGLYPYKCRFRAGNRKMWVRIFSNI
jgi:hypothetical protein